MTKNSWTILVTKSIHCNTLWCIQIHQNAMNCVTLKKVVDCCRQTWFARQLILYFNPPPFHCNLLQCIKFHKNSLICVKSKVTQFSAIPVLRKPTHIWNSSDQMSCEFDLKSNEFGSHNRPIIILLATHNHFSVLAILTNLDI